MKITTFFLIIIITGLFATGTHSQVSKVNIDAQNISVNELLQEIEKQTDYLFIYNPNEINLNRKTTVRVKDKAVVDVLAHVFNQIEVVYAIEGSSIMLMKKGSYANSTLQQEVRVITGKVIDVFGEPIIGASISVKGTSVGVITDVNGNYSMKIPHESSRLLVSYIGMKPKELVIGNQSRIDVQMEDDVVSLQEIVAVGYATQRKVNLTGNIASVKTEDLGTIPASNLSNTIAGRAPGVNVIGNTGLAGASSSIRMRGSFVDPLFVINGIIKSKADFDALDANEVESINFLKDAATASVYGSKAGDGVVLVTTKAGTFQKAKFEYKGSYSAGRTTKPVQNYTATQELEYLNQMDITKGVEPRYGQDVFDYFKDKTYSINDYIWQNPSTNQHNLSVNGGNEQITYYLMLGYHGEEGSYKNLNYDKYNFRSDITAKITKRFKVNFNLSGNQRNYDRWYWPYDEAEDFAVGDFFRATFNWSRLYPFYVDELGNPTDDTSKFPVTPGAWHPVELMTNSGAYRDIRYRTLDGILKFDLDLSDIIKGLSTSMIGSYTAADRNMKSFVKHNKAYLFQSADANNKFIPGPIDPTKINLHNLSSNYENIAEEARFIGSYQINWMLRYDRKFDEHAVSALGVYEQSKTDTKNLSGRADELLSPVIDQIYNTSSDISKRWFEGNEQEYARQSWIGRLNYTFADKYIAEFSFRYDGNYKFAPGKRWGFFPSYSAAWRISEEGFMENINWISNLKLRGSYGTAGNDINHEGKDITAFQWSQQYQKKEGYVFGNTFYDGLEPGVMPNPYITWATSKMADLGVDFGFLNQKLTGDFGVFSRVQSDLLATRLGSTPSTLGAELPAVNYAKRSWKGAELSLLWTDHIGQIRYSVYGNMGYSIDKWDRIDEATAYTDGTYKDNWRSKLGKPNNRLYGLICEKMIRNQAELDALPEEFTQFGRKPMLGTLLFKDIRGDNYSEGADGKIDDNDKTYLSDNATPRINYGFGFKVEYKGLGINAHFQGVGSYDRMVKTRNGDGVFQVDRPYFELWSKNYWTNENPGAKYPRIAGDWMNPEYGGGPSTFWVRNGAYLRLKNLDVSYTIPVRYYSKLGLGKVQVFTNFTNLFCISGLNEHDPEQETLDSYPIMKSYTGGLILNF